MAELIPVKVTETAGTIEDNLAEVEASIREKTKEYCSVVITEDAVKDGKKFLADIRKEKKALSDELRDIKRQWMAPYDAFEKRAKKVIALYDEPVAAINSQLASYEQKRVELKRQEVQAIYEMAVPEEFRDWLPLDRIYNSRWENATFSGKKIREEIEAALDRMKVSISTIRSMKSEFEKEGLDKLKETLSLSDALARMNALQAQKEYFQKRQEAEQARKAQQEEEAEQARKAQQEEEAEQARKAQQEEEAEQAAQNDTVDPGPFDSVDPGPFVRERLLTVQVKVSESDLPLLQSFLEQEGFEYEVIGHG